MFDMDLQVFQGSKLTSRSSDYLVKDLIRRGSFEKVVKCVKSATREMVTVKITKINSVSEAEEKNSTLQKLKAFNPDIWNLARWESSFIFRGHLCQEFELLDMSLKDYTGMRQSPSFPLKEVRHILFQVATALQLLKSLGIVHANLNLENIVLVDHIKEPLRVKLMDSGSAWNVSKGEQASYIQPKFYRAPEAILGLTCNEAIDMWALGCIAAELFLGHPLYPGCCDYELLWYITKTQGQLPGYLLNTGLKTNHYYRRTWPNIWVMKTPYEYARIPMIHCPFASLDDLKNIPQTPDSHPSKAAPEAEKVDLEEFVELVKKMLLLESDQRITPSQLLEHSFITMSHLVNFWCPQRPSSSQGETERDQSSSTSSSEAQSPEDQQQVPEANESSMVCSQQLKTRKKTYDDVLQECNKDRDCMSPERKKVKIDQRRPLVKRPYSAIYQGAKRIHEICSPERKRRRLTPDTERDDTKTQLKLPESKTRKRTYDDILQECNKDQDCISPERKKVKIDQRRPLVKRPYSAIYQGTKRIHEICSPERKRRRLTPDTERDDTKTPGTPEEDSSCVAQTLNKGPGALNQGPKGDRSTGIDALKEDPPNLTETSKTVSDNPKMRFTLESPKFLKSQTETDIQVPKEGPSVVESPKGGLSAEVQASKEGPSFLVQVPTEEKPSTVIEAPEEGLSTEVQPPKEDPGPMIQPGSTERKGSHSDSTTPCEVTKPPKIWIIGSSYIQKGKKAALELFGENFGLPAEVEWFGKGSMGWRGVLPRFKNSLLDSQSPPDILVVHAGGNDLGIGSAQTLADKMKADLIKLHEEFPSMKIAFSCINERQVWRYNEPLKTDNDRKMINQCIRQAAGRFGGEIIEHPLVRFWNNKLFEHNGVHFSQQGNEIFLTSIHNTLKKILQK